MYCYGDFVPVVQSTAIRCTRKGKLLEPWGGSVLGKQHLAGGLGQLPPALRGVHSAVRPDPGGCAGWGRLLKHPKVSWGGDDVMGRADPAHLRLSHCCAARD